MTTPSLKPIQIKSHTCKQRHYGDLVPKLAMRSLLVGPSSSGKTVLLTNMIIDNYKCCFSISCMWSPSIEVDNTWKPVKDYIRDHIKPNDREKCYVDNYDPSEFEQVIKTSYILQQQVIYYTTTSYVLPNKRNHQELYQCLTGIDEFADDRNVTRMSQLLQQLCIRGRHYMISTITSAQVYKQISQMVRTNMTHLFIYRLRNYGDLEYVIEELSAMYDKQYLFTNIS